MKVFVAGATGNLGRRVVPGILAAGHQVTGIARTAEKAAQLEAAGATSVQVDLFDAAAVERAVAGHEVVVNIATHIPSASRGVLPGAMREHDRIRTEGAANLAAAALATGASRYIQESISFPYADSGDTWVDESAAFEVPSAFAAVTEAEAAAARVTAAGSTGVVLRFALFHSADGVLTLDTVKLARRGYAAVPGDPAAYLAAIHVDDAATAVVAALDCPAGTYNVVDEEPLRRSEYTDVLAAALGRDKLKLPPKPLQRLGGSRMEALSRSQRLSAARLRGATGWLPAYPSMREAWPAIVRGIGAA